MGQGTREEVWVGSRDPRGGPGQVEGPTGRCGTDRGSPEEVWDGSGDSRGGLGRVV